jgi:LAO/AO transport system kinase
MAAASFDPVIVETVGVGQAEVEIASLADLTLLVLVPGLGDEVQTMKAGIMEIADLIVLNKADRQGIDQLESAVMASLELLSDQAARPPVIRCSAQTGQGIGHLTEEILEFVSEMSGREEMARRRTSLILESIIREKGREMAREAVAERFGSVEEAVDSILRGETTPYGIGGILSEYSGRTAGE